MAIGTADGEMPAGKRECRQIMIILGGIPGGFVMTYQAILWKIALGVIGFSHAIVIILVAAKAIGRQRVLVVGMTIIAVDRSVRAAQFKSGCLKMIEFGIVPI